MKSTFFRAALIVLILLGPVCIRHSASESLPQGKNPKGAALQTNHPGKYYLKIDISGSGKGKVRVEPAQVECRTEDRVCSFGFDPGTKLMLTAEPAELPNAFSGWIGHCAAPRDKAGACRIIMDNNRRIAAGFSRKPEPVISFP